MDERWRAHLTRSRFGWWVRYHSGLICIGPPTFRWTRAGAERTARRGIRRLNAADENEAAPIVIT